jgi:alpha-L-fucosidase
MKQFMSRREFVRAVSASPFTLAALPFGRAAELGRYQPTWESLSQYRVPPWYEDAKFGIFLHWGVYSVPAHSSEWYPRLMYRRADEVFNYHREHWGPQSMFGYKDFIPMFRAERWDPDAWAELFKQAGAKYIVPVGEHHDGFPMYDCIFSDWTAVKMGPRRDVVGELGRAVRNQRLKLGVSSHRAFDWSYYTFEPDFDTSNPRFSGLYGTPHAPTPRINNHPGELRQTAPREFLEDWFSRSVNIVDRYQPDLVWFDFGFEAPEFEPYRKQFAAHYYSQAEEWGQGVVINYKHDAYPENVAVLDVERGLLENIRPRIWQTDTSVGRKSWGYIRDEDFKPAEEIVHELVDIVSKHGCLLLNVGPKPDGTIPDEARAILLNIGRWLETNGEAIYGTRPWKIFGEGPTRLRGGDFGEEKHQGFTAEDFRFTAGNGAVYVVCLGWPDKDLKIKSLGSASETQPGKIAAVRMLGSDESLKWTQRLDALTICLPAAKPACAGKPCEFAYTFKAEVRT